jgi:hypothetical protein
MVTAPAVVGAAFLPAVAAHLDDRHPLDPGFGQRVAHLVELERLDHRHNHFHDITICRLELPC